MSSLIVEVSKIDEIQEHDNADKLEIAIIKGWQCITQKGKFKKDDKVIYIPIDSLIPFELSDKLGITNYLFNHEKEICKSCKGLGSINGITCEECNGCGTSEKILFSRIKTIKLRGVISQGLIIDIQDKSWKIGKDVKKELGIKKYIPRRQISSGKNNNYSPKWNPPKYKKFDEYIHIENYKNHINIFEEGEEVVATEKIHGTNTRVACLPVDMAYYPFLKRIELQLKRIGNKLTFGFIPYDKNIFLVGSHHKNLTRCYSENLKYREQNLKNLYWRVALDYKLDNKLKEGEEIFGEIYGRGVQKYFEYDGLDRLKAKYFDIKVLDKKSGVMKYIDWDDFVERCNELELPIVPVLYRGPFDRKILPDLINGKSTIGNHIREGCVIRPVKERFSPKLGRTVLKCINDDYLLFKGKKEDELQKKGEVAEIDIFDH